MPVSLLHFKTTPLDSLGGLPLKFSQLRGDGTFETFSRASLEGHRVTAGIYGEYGQIRVSVVFQSSHQATPRPFALASFVHWDRKPLRRRDFKRRRRRSSTHTNKFTPLLYLFISAVSVFYYTSPNRSSPVIILLDSLQITYILTPTINRVVPHLKAQFQESISGWEVTMQSTRNKLAHISHGNTTQTTPPTRITLNLNELVPPDPEPWDFQIPPKLSRGFLLQCRNTIETTPPSTHSPLPMVAPVPQRRSGRRKVNFSTTVGKTYYTAKRNRRRRFSNSTHRIKGINIETDKPTPPQRGTPGTASAVNEECYAPTPTPTTPLIGRGTRGRRLRRRMYRQWRRLSRGNIRPEVPGNALARGGLPLKAVQRYKQEAGNNAKAFRKLVLAPKSNRNKQSVHTTTPPVDYGAPFRIGTQNVQGMAELLKHQAVLGLMKARALDVLILTETRAISYYSFQSEGYTFIVNGNNKDKFAGVTAVVSPQARPFLHQVTQHTNRIIELEFSCKSGNIHIIGVYSPHDKSEDEIKKAPFWDRLQEVVEKIPLPEPVYIIGDFNVRLQGRTPEEGNIIGPHVYGKGRNHIKQLEGSNRAYYARFLEATSTVDALTFKQSDLLKHVTYRDKQATPLDWLALAADPIGWVQVYDKFQKVAGVTDEALVLVNHIREYATSAFLPKPPQTTPRVDPLRFQNLDKLVVRHKWLPSVQKVQALHNQGFPSDHYPLEAVIKIKLKASPQPGSRLPKYDYSAFDNHKKQQFNQELRWQLDYSAPAPDTSTMEEDWDIYTDGSGSSGRCRENTPAGWGFVVVCDNQKIHTSRGPVQTDPRSVYYLGARVGSNNTGELSAWLEAALYLLTLQTLPSTVTFFYDSKWTAGMVRGEHRPKRHKQLVYYAKEAFQILQTRTTVQWCWVKGHSGDTHNNTADALAEAGKRSTTPLGGRASLPLMATPQTIQSSDTQTATIGYRRLASAMKSVEEKFSPKLPENPSSLGLRQS